MSTPPLEVESAVRMTSQLLACRDAFFSFVTLMRELESLKKASHWIHAKFIQTSWFSNMTLRQQRVMHWYPMACLNRLQSQSRQEEDLGALWAERRPMSMSHWPRQHRWGSRTQYCNSWSKILRKNTVSSFIRLPTRGLTVHGCPAHHTQGCPKVFLPSSLKPTCHLV